MQQRFQRIAFRPLACFVLVFTIFSTKALAQANLFQSETKPVRATIKTSAKEAAPGDAIEVIVQVRMSKGFHVYGGDDTNSPNIPTLVKLTLPTGLAAVGGWTNAPAAVKSKEGPLIYTNAVAFHRWVKIGPDAPHKSLTITAELQYQACNDNECYPPDTVPLEAPLTIVDKTQPQPK